MPGARRYVQAVMLRQLIQVAAHVAHSESDLYAIKATFAGETA